MTSCEYMTIDKNQRTKTSHIPNMEHVHPSKKLNQAFPGAASYINKLLDEDQACVGQAICNVYQNRPLIKKKEKLWYEKATGVLLFVKDFKSATYRIEIFDVDKNRIDKSLSEEMWLKCNFKFYALNPDKDDKSGFMQFSSAHGKYQVGYLFHSIEEYQLIKDLIKTKIWRE